MQIFVRILVFIVAFSILGFGYLHTKTPAPLPPPAGLTPRLNLEQRGWMLATSAILTEMNHTRHETLSEIDLTPQNIQTTKDTIRKWWGINSKEDMIEKLDWLEKEGHRAQFDEFASHMEQPDTQAFIKNYAQIQKTAVSRFGLEKATQLHDFRLKLEVVRLTYKQLGKKSILAWDYGRYMSMCRWGYEVGYFSEEEVWSRMYPMALQIQNNFSSWQDFANDYFIGRHFWNTNSDANEEQAVLTELLKAPYSPWQRYPWNTNLKLNK